MATSSFITELKFDTKEKTEAFIEAIEDTKKRNPLNINVDYKIPKGNEIKEFFLVDKEEK